MHLLIRELRQMGGKHANCAEMLEELQSRTMFQLSYVQTQAAQSEPVTVVLNKPQNGTEYRLYVWYPEEQVEFRCKTLFEVLQRERYYDRVERRKAVNQCN